jgi:hypothetical protein
MSNSLLIPNHYKRLGFIILIPFLVLGALCMFRDFNFSWLDIGKSINLTDEIALTGTIAGLLMIAFSKEKTEDEYISTLRLESLQKAVLIHYILLVIATWAVHSLAYIQVMVYNMLTIPIIFIIRFHYVLAKNKA